MKAVIIVVVLFLSVATEASVWASKRMKIDEKLSEEVESVLSLTADFHKLRVAKKEIKARELASSLLKKISEAKSLSEKHHPIENVHITKILDSAYSSLQSYSSSPQAPAAIGGLKNFFKEVVQITQVFDVKKYKIFFCPLDRALWLQKDAKARNPVNLKFVNCGKPV